VNFSISPDIATLTPYVPGKPVETLQREMGIKKSIIKLASNENPLGPSPMAMQAVRSGIRSLSRYPDGAGYSLRTALSERWSVSPQQICIGNGSNEMIELLVRAFILPADEVILSHPSFSLYRLMVQAGHGVSITIPLRDGCYDLPAIAQAVTSKTRLIFICNPNNPTGTAVGHHAMEALLKRIPNHVLVVCDEAYAEYATLPDFPNSVQWLKEGAPMIMLRTFSKIYGLAGLRIGYGIGPAEAVGYLERVRQPFNTNVLAQRAALAALSDDAHVARSLEINRGGAEYLSRQFDAMGIPYLPTQTNFIYFTLHEPIGPQVYTALLQDGVIIRHLEQNHMRVTIGLPQENRRFIRALKKTLSVGKV